LSGARETGKLATSEIVTTWHASKAWPALQEVTGKGDAPKNDTGPDYEELARLRQELIDFDADLTMRRNRYRAFVASIAGLRSIPKAEAWLGYIASHMENYGDQEALVYRISRGIPCEPDVRALIERWKADVDRAHERYLRDGLAFDRTRGYFKPPEPKRPGQSLDVAGTPRGLLPNFWGFYDNEELRINATMLRAVEWGEIGGFEDWWERLAIDEKDSVIQGGISTVPASYWLFHMCRSNKTISLLGNTLRRALESIEISEQGLAAPWSYYKERKDGDGRVMRHVDHIPLACSIAFSSFRLPHHALDERLVKRALEMILGRQRGDGSWPCWSDEPDSCPEATAFAVHALVSHQPLGWQRACASARDWLLTAQDPDGCWRDEGTAGQVYLTVLVLDAIELAEGGDRTTFSPTAAVPNISRSPMATRGSRRFKVALSFPGEIRTKVQGVANALARTLGRDKVFYDKRYEAELARLNLDVYMQSVYHKQTDLIVVFFCPEYEKKDWCGLEWRAIRDLIKQRGDVDIMLVKMGDVELGGLFSIDGYVDGKAKSPGKLAEPILERVANPAV
jgi:hypothetical protein